MDDSLAHDASVDKQPEEIQNASRQQFLAEAKRIYDELQLINSHKIVRVYDSVPKLILFRFIKGVLFGLGSVVGATIVVSILAYLLSHVEFNHR